MGQKHAHNWKGGRVIASNGYVLIYVGKEHHLADVRGYVYEHRLVAEQKIGRRLLPGEQVHHIDESKQNNHPDNLEVVSGIAEHQVRHREYDRGLRMPGEENPIINCACGCGSTLEKYDSSNRPRKYISGHNPRPSSMVDWFLWYIAHVPEPTTTRYIASFFDCNKHKVSAALSKLKKRGKVFRENGSWFATSADVPLPGPVEE